jgi:hypothetical protein
LKVFIKYDSKEPYLPVAVAESKSELARILGVTLNSVISSYAHKRSTYAVVDIEDD